MVKLQNMKLKFLSFCLFFLLFLSLIGCSSTTKQVSSINKNAKDVLTQEEDAEYLRSIASVSSTEKISVDTFTKDKKDILSLIDQIEESMRTGNYQKWISFVDQESIIYWQNPKNLKDHPASTASNPVSN